MQSIKEAASIVLAASFTVLMVSAFILSSLATLASGIGVCRNDFNGPCGTNAPPTNPCSNKPGTISWPSSGGCVPSFCPPGGNKEVRGARLNSGECDPNFNSGSVGNNNNGGGGTGAAAMGAIGGPAPWTNWPPAEWSPGEPPEPPGLSPPGVVPTEQPPGEGYTAPELPPDYTGPGGNVEFAPGYGYGAAGQQGVIPSESPIGDTVVNVNAAEQAAVDAAADEAVGGAATVAATVAAVATVAIIGFSVGYYIGCGFEIC
jgi:hypothetical protein